MLDAIQRIPVPSGEDNIAMSLPLEAIVSKEEDVIVFDYIMTASSSMTDYQYPPDLKYGIDELCPVCGDKVSGYHYGLQTCESCKGFFKRTVQNKKVYSCVDNRSCHIDKSQRKRCPFCRFQKCLSVGMKLEAVRTDRMRGGRNKFGPMYKRDRALKQQALRQRQQLLAQCQLQVNGAMSAMDLNMDPSAMAMQQQYGLHSHQHHTSPLYNSGLTNMTPGEMPDIKPNINMLMPSVLGQNMDNHNQMLAAYSNDNIITHANRHSSVHLGNMNNVNMLQGLGHSHSHSQVPSSGGQLQPLKPLHPQHQQHHHHHQQQLSPNSDSENQNTSNSLPPLPMTSTSSQAATSVYAAPPAPSHHHHPHNSNSSSSSFPAGLITEISHVMNGNINAHYNNQNLPPPLTPTPTVLPSLIKSLQHNELQEAEVQQKLAVIAESQLLVLQQQPEILQDHSKQWLQLACKLADQYLFLLVEWARAAVFFKELKVEDQMKLLQNCWSELIILDFIYKQRHNTSPDIFTLITGHKVSLDIISKLGLPEFKERLCDLIRKFHDLNMDHHEYTCLKFLILLNPDVQGVNNASHLEQSQEKINLALQEYCTLFHADLKDKVGQLLLRLPEIRMLSLCIEEYLYFRHTAGDIPEQTLLMELLHAKRK